jgi:ribosomal protein S18 acetylase RimI-like enzyme
MTSFLSKDVISFNQIIFVINFMTMGDDEILIKRLGSRDLDELRVISRETFYESFAWGNSEENMQSYLDEAFSYTSLRKELDDPASAFYFATFGEHTIGYMKLNIGKAQTDLKDNNSLELARIYIKKEYQGRHTGKILLDKVLNIAKEKRVDFVWLGVWEKNQGAIRFYERNGFVKYSTHSFMLGNDRQTDLIMKLNMEL